MSPKRTLIQRLRKVYAASSIEAKRVPNIADKSLVFYKGHKFALESRTRWRPKDSEKPYLLGDLFLFLENCRKKGNLSSYMDSWRKSTKEHAFTFQLISNKHRAHIREWGNLFHFIRLFYFILC